MAELQVFTIQCPKSLSNPVTINVKGNCCAHSHLTCSTHRTADLSATQTPHYSRFRQQFVWKLILDSMAEGNRGIVPWIHCSGYSCQGVFVPDKSHYHKQKQRWLGVTRKRTESLWPAVSRYGSGVEGNLLQVMSLIQLGCLFQFQRECQTLV